MSSVNVQRIGAVNAFCDATKRLRGWVETQTEGDAVSLHARAELTEYVFTKTADFTYCDRDLINGPKARALVALRFQRYASSDAFPRRRNRNDTSCFPAPGDRPLTQRNAPMSVIHYSAGELANLAVSAVGGSTASDSGKRALARTFRHPGIVRRSKPGGLRRYLRPGAMRPVDRGHIRGAIGPYRNGPRQSVRWAALRTMPFRSAGETSLTKRPRRACCRWQPAFCPDRRPQADRNQAPRQCPGGFAFPAPRRPAGGPGRGAGRTDGGGRAEPQADGGAPGGPRSSAGRPGRRPAPSGPPAELGAETAAEGGAGSRAIGIEIAAERGDRRPAPGSRQPWHFVIGLTTAKPGVVLSVQTTHSGVRK